MNKHIAMGLAGLIAACVLTGPGLAQQAQGAAPGGELVPYRKGNLWGYSTLAKKIVVAPQFGDAQRFSEGLAAVSVKQGGKFADGYIDAGGKLVIAPQFGDARDFHQGLAAVSVNGKFGFINKAGVMVVPAKYSDTRPFSEGLAGVEADGKWGFVDARGREITPLKYYEVYSLEEGLAMVEMGDAANDQHRCGYIDATGREVIALDFYSCDGFSEGLAHVRRPASWDAGGQILDGFISKNGAYAIKLSTDYYLASEFHDGWSAVGGHYVDKGGKTVLSTSYEDVGDFLEGLAKASNGQTTGYINKAGKAVIPVALPDEDSLLCYGGGFHDGRAAITLKDKCGFIDKTGKLVIPAKYDTTLGFKNGLAYVQVGQDGGYIGPDGTEYFEK